MTDRPTPAAPLSTDELRLLATREKRTQAKRDERARKVAEQAASAQATNPTGYVVPPMPAGLRKQRRWLRRVQDAFSVRRAGLIDLTEARRSVAAQADTYRAAADVRRSVAAMRQAEATERLATTLAAVEHGGAVIGFMTRLQESLANGGQRRPLPGVRAPLPIAPGSGS